MRRRPDHRTGMGSPARAAVWPHGRARAQPHHHQGRLSPLRLVPGWTRMTHTSPPSHPARGQLAAGAAPGPPGGQPPQDGYNLLQASDRLTICVSFPQKPRGIQRDHRVPRPMKRGLTGSPTNADRSVTGWRGWHPRPLPMVAGDREFSSRKGASFGSGFMTGAGASCA